MTLEAALAENAAQRELIKSQSALIEKLMLELAILKKRLFGRQSEASDHLDLQASLFDVTTLPIDQPGAPAALPMCLSPHLDGRYRLLDLVG